MFLCAGFTACVADALAVSYQVLGKSFARKTLHTLPFQVKLYLMSPVSNWCRTEPKTLTVVEVET